MRITMQSVIHHLLFFVTVIICSLFAPSQQAHSQSNAKVPGVDFPIPIAGRYQDILNNLEMYKDKIVIGELYIRADTHKEILLADHPMALSRFKIYKNKLTQQTAYLDQDYVLVKAKVFGETMDSRVAGYQERFVVLKPVLGFALSPKSNLDVEGNPVVVPAEGVINDERAFRQIMRDVESYRGRIVAWQLTVEKIMNGKVLFHGPMMTDIKVLMQYKGLLKKQKLQRNDVMSMKSKILGVARTNLFGRWKEKVLALDVPTEIIMQQADPLF